MNAEVSTRLGWHIATLEKVLTQACWAIVSAYRTIPVTTLYRDISLPTISIALDANKYRFAAHLMTTDRGYPFFALIKLPLSAKAAETTH